MTVVLNHLMLDFWGKVADSLNGVYQGHYAARIKVGTPDNKQVTCLTGVFKL